MAKVCTFLSPFIKILMVAAKFIEFAPASFPFEAMYISCQRFFVFLLDFHETTYKHVNIGITNFQVEGILDFLPGLILG